MGVTPGVILLLGLGFAACDKEPPPVPAPIARNANAEPATPAVEVPRDESAAPTTPDVPTDGDDTVTDGTATDGDQVDEGPPPPRPPLDAAAFDALLAAGMPASTRVAECEGTGTTFGGPTFQMKDWANGTGDGDDTYFFRRILEVAPAGAKIVLSANHTFMIGEPLIVNRKRICVVGLAGSALKEIGFEVPGTDPAVVDARIGRMLFDAAGAPIQVASQPAERAMLKLYKAHDSVVVGVNGVGAMSALSPTWAKAPFENHDYDGLYPSFLWVMQSDRVVVRNVHVQGRMRGLTIQLSNSGSYEGFEVEGFLPGTDAAGLPLANPSYDHARLMYGFNISGGTQNTIAGFRARYHGNVGNTGEGTSPDDGFSYQSTENVVKDCVGEHLFESGLYHNGQNEMVVGCHMSDVRDNVGIMMRGTGNIIVGNTVKDVHNAGIGISGNGVNFSSGDPYNGRGSAILANTVANCEQTGMYMEGYGPANATVRGIVMAYNTLTNVVTSPYAKRPGGLLDDQYGIRVDVTQGARIVENALSVSGLATYAIGSKEPPSVGSRPSDVRVLGNTVTVLGTPTVMSSGIDFRYADRALAIGNTVANIGSGIDYVGAINSEGRDNTFDPGKIDTETIASPIDTTGGGADSDGTPPFAVDISPCEVQKSGGFRCGTPPKLATPFVVPAVPPVVAPGGKVTFAGNNLIRLSDRPDTAATYLVLHAVAGKLNLATDQGLKLHYGQATGSSLVVLEGTTGTINAALNGLAFTADTNLGVNGGRVEITVVDKIVAASNKSSVVFDARAIGGGYPSETVSVSLPRAQ